MSSRGPNHDMKGEHVLKVEAELRTNGRTNGCARTDAHERTDVRTNEWIMDENVSVRERTNDGWSRTYKYAERMDGRMNEWYERMDEQMDEQMNEWMRVCQRCYVRPRGLVPSTQWMKPYV